VLALLRAEPLPLDELTAQIQALDANATLRENGAVTAPGRSRSLKTDYDVLSKTWRTVAAFTAESPRRSSVFEGEDLPGIGASTGLATNDQLATTTLHRSGLRSGAVHDLAVP
jgi:hypothetical protein